MRKYNLTGDEINLAASLLAKLQPGYLPEPLFDQITRLVVCSTIVVVVCKKTPQGLQVLLCKREGDKPGNRTWPGHWHLPGTMLRPSDKAGDYSDAFNRLLQGELGSTIPQSSLHFIRTAFAQTKRGHEHTSLHYLVIDTDEPLQGQFFPLNQLPKPLIEHEVPYIQEAVKLVST